MIPAVLAEAHDAGYFVDHESRDFEPFDEPIDPATMLDWFSSWTDGPPHGEAPFWAFGQDGSGGLAALWVRPGSRPIVFFGSEGEVEVIAKDLGDYLWLLADGVGPLESLEPITRTPEPIPALVAIARRHTGAESRPFREILADAKAERPSLVAWGEAFTGQSWADE